MAVVNVQLVRHHVKGKLLVVSPFDSGPRFSFEILEQKSVQIFAVQCRPNFEVGRRCLSFAGWLGRAFPRDDVAAICRMGEHLNSLAVGQEGNVSGRRRRLEIASNDANGGFVNEDARTIGMEAVERGETRRKRDATGVGRRGRH